MSEASSEERADWVRLALQSLARAYSDDEPECSRDQEANTEYEEGDVITRACQTGNIRIQLRRARK